MIRVISPSRPVSFINKRTTSSPAIDILSTERNKTDYFNHKRQFNHTSLLYRQKSTCPPSPPRHQRPIYVAATKRHVGKTSVSIALIAGLQKRFNKVGFIKPVGQVRVPVESTELQSTIFVDKDVCLMREHFGLDHVDYSYMSPVLIPRGYTKDYLDGKISHQDQYEKIRTAYRKLDEESDIVLCEGTGHCAVGSIVHMNNARVAAMLGADMVLVANGGLGSTIDELELNRVLCHHHGVRIAGFIINKVDPQKYDQTKRLLSKAMMNMWGIPLLGCVPDRPFLGCPALIDLERLYQTELISGQKHRMRHFTVKETELVTCSTCEFVKQLRSNPGRVLYFCHATRDDVILTFLGEYQRKTSNGEPFESALVICEKREKYKMSRLVYDMLKGQDVPIMPVQMSTYEAMEHMHNLTPKLKSDDKSRVNSTMNHYCNYIDFDELLRRTSETSVSGIDHSSHVSYGEMGRL